VYVLERVEHHSTQKSLVSRRQQRPVIAASATRATGPQLSRLLPSSSRTTRTRMIVVFVTHTSNKSFIHPLLATPSSSYLLFLPSFPPGPQIPGWNWGSVTLQAKNVTPNCHCRPPIGAFQNAGIVPPTHPALTLVSNTPPISLFLGSRGGYCPFAGNRKLVAICFAHLLGGFRIYNFFFVGGGGGGGVLVVFFCLEKNGRMQR